MSEGTSERRWTRYLVDVTMTIEVECESPAEIEAAVASTVADFALDLHVGDFSVVEPPEKASS